MLPSLSCSTAIEPESEPEPRLPHNLKRTSASPNGSSSSPSKKRRVSAVPARNEDDSSVTEPETEPTPGAALTKVEDDDSVTEPESESELDVVQRDEDDSETEPESESDGEEDDGGEDEDEDLGEGGIRKIHTRPSFPLRPDQTLLDPLILSPSYLHVSSTATSSTSSTKPRPIQVPTSINTHLRDYQRDGAQFFWERYEENRGGLLGDDMGLVYPFPLSFCL